MSCRRANVAIQIYSDYFGKLPYDHVALTAAERVQLRPELADAGVSADLRILGHDGAARSWGCWTTTPATGER